VAYTTLTRYLKLKVDSDLSADAVYNLQRIDALASTFVVDATEKLKIQSKGNIEIEPYDLALGGTGSGGAVEIGTAQHSNVEFRAYTGSFKVDSGIETKNQATNKTNYLKLAFEDSSTSAAKTLKWKLSGDGDTRSLEVVHDGVVVTEDGEQTLTDKTIDADANDISNVRDGNIAADAAIAYSKLALTGSVVNADLVAGIDAAKVADGSVSNSEFQALNGVTSALQTQLDSKASAGANSDITSLSGLTTALSVAQGGTGNDGSNKATALFDLLPSQTGNSNKVLGLNSGATGLEWKTFAAGGTVEAVESNTQLTLSLDGKTIGFAAGTASQYLRGDNTWQTLDKSAAGLGNVDNTSDANKPVSSATQDALDLKYDASNPSNYVDASGAAAAAPVQSVNGQTDVVVLDTDDVSEGTAKYFTDTRARDAVVKNTPDWNETTYAPSANAVAGYVTANSGPKVTSTWTSSTGTETFTVNHTFGTDPVSVVIYDANGKTVWIDEEDRNNGSVDLTRTASVAPGNWTVIIKKL
jgi:hypothetical protein